MAKDLVLVGGGHAHLTALLKLDSYVRRGHRVTLISPSPYHYYSGMGPGMLSGIYRPQEARFHIKKLAEGRGGVFIEDRVIKVNPANHILLLQSGREVNYDIVSFNTGSEVFTDPLLASPQEAVYPVKPVVNLLKARRNILPALIDRPLQFVVMGGGPAGIEISTNLWRLITDNNGKAQITIIGGKKILGAFPDKVRKLALKSIKKRGIEVIEGNRAKEIQKKSIALSDGKTLSFDFAFLAVGIKPLPLFRNSNLPASEDGGLLVNSYLQSVAHPEIFAGGDCLSFAERPLAKVGVYAVRQNPILFHNLRAALEGGRMRVFKPQKDYMLILNMGDGTGLFWKKNWVWAGRFFFFLKNYIDRQFMKKFQVSGELSEKENGTA